MKLGTATLAYFCRSNPTALSNARIAAPSTIWKAKPKATTNLRGAQPMRRYIPSLLLAAILSACGSQRAVRPEAPAPVVAEIQNNTISYRAANGRRITAVYLNDRSPLAVELRQGSTVEILTQVSAWAQGAEYSNGNTRWHVQDNAATLIRRNQRIRYQETDG